MAYDEFGMLRENAEEAGLPFDGAPRVARVDATGSDGHKVSALRWGEGEPEIVLIHGGAQNAHTWDTVALALKRPLLAVDLPGHGHSDWRDDGEYGPVANARALAAVLPDWAPNAGLVVGMSLGGLTSAVLAATHPELVKRLVMVDVTPGVNRAKAAAIIDFVKGPEDFDSFDVILERTILHNPTRSEASLRRGVLHNAKEIAGGRWTWRYDRRRFAGTSEEEANDAPVFVVDLWEYVAKIRAPVMLCRGALSPVVDDADVAELLRLQPETQVEVVEGAGHSIQGDKPLELARLIENFRIES